MSEAKVLKLADIEKQLGVCRWTLYHWLREGKIRGFKLPCGHYRIPVTELDKVINEMKRIEKRPKAPKRQEHAEASRQNTS